MASTRTSFVLGLALGLAAASAALGAGCGGANADGARGGHDATSSNTDVANHVQSARNRAPARADSNVAWEDYAGSDACAPCHADIVDRWRRSPMHNMTREARGADVKAPFEGETFAFKGDTVTLRRAGQDRFFEISAKGGRARAFRMTRVIGGHHREDYAAVEVSGVKPDARTYGDGTDEWVMPVSYVFHTKSLRYKGYSVMVHERPFLHEGPEWPKTCIFCHNTVPYLDTVLGALSGKRAPYQGEVVDPLLPPERRFAYRVSDAAALDALLRGETARLGAEIAHDAPDKELAQAINVVRNRFRASSLLETGIGCESCHNGARAHVEKPSLHPDLWPKSPAFSVGPADAHTPTHAEKVTRTCARCHQVLFSKYPFTWEGGSRNGNPGGSNINSGEARDLLLGKCKSELTCTQCHDPHAFDNDTKSRSEDAVCTQCHAKFAAKDAALAHTHHRAEGEGSRCVSCHMPRKNLSLDNRLTRYHRIGSPNDPERALLDRPLECALCHTDKTARFLADTMAAWWKRPIDAHALETLYGSLDANVVTATIERGKPHEQAVALWLAGDKKMRAAAPLVARALTHDIPMVRFFARDALEKIAGAPFAIDLDADEADIERARDEFLAAHKLQ